MGVGTVRGHEPGAQQLSDVLDFPRGVVILSPERSYTLDLGPGDLQAPPNISRTQDLVLPGRTCALSWPASLHTQARLERPRGRRHSPSHRVRMNSGASVVPEGQAPHPQSPVFPEPSKEQLSTPLCEHNLLSSPSNPGGYVLSGAPFQ